MEKFTQFRDRGSGIAPFLPIPFNSLSISLPIRIFVAIVRLLLIGPVLVFYFGLLQWLPLEPIFKKACIGWTLLVSTIFWNDLQVDGVRKGSLSRQPNGGRMPGPGDVVAASFTSPIDAIYLAFIFDPIFTASYPNCRKVEHISFLQAILRAFASPRVYPPATANMVDLAVLIKQYPDRTIATFPECTTTNARAILPLSRSLLSAPPNTRIFPVSLRYTPADIVTPLPGHYVRFLWALVSEWKHWARVRIAEPVVRAKISVDSAGPSGATRRATYDTNYLDTFDAAQGDSSSTSEDGAVTPSEKALLNQVADALARLGRVRRVGLAVREKEDFVRMWTRNQRQWLWWF